MMIIVIDDKSIRVLVDELLLLLCFDRVLLSYLIRMEKVNVEEKDGREEKNALFKCTPFACKLA